MNKGKKMLNAERERGMLLYLRDEDQGERRTVREPRPVRKEEDH